MERSSCCPGMPLSNNGYVAQAAIASIPSHYLYLKAAALVAALFFWVSVAHSAAVLSIDPAPVTWNVVGLDSNNQTVGPQDFPVGIRVLNTGTMDSGPVTATFAWTSANANINLIYDGSVTTTTIPAGGYADFYFTVRLNRTSAVFDTSRSYSITVTGADIPMALVETDTLFAERLVSQQSNDVLDLVGPNTITAGETRTFILTAETQNNGRDQVEQFVNFPNQYFQILDIQTTYSFPSPGVGIDRFYADACGWDRTDTSPGNDTCDGPAAPYGAQVGNDIIVVYTVYIKQTPTAPVHLTTLILDVGGNSFHYNTDFGLNVLVVSPPADLSIVKTAVDNPVEAGDQLEYHITVLNPAGSPVANNVVVKDFLPAGLTYVSAVPPPSTVGNPLVWNMGNMASSSTLQFSVIAQSSCLNTGNFTNTATVESTTEDTNPANNASSQTVTVQDTTSPTLTCPANIILDADANLCSRSNVTYGAHSVSDNCTTAPVTVTFVPAAGSTFPVGTTTVNATATDAAGNKAFCSFTVTIRDNQVPTINCQGPINSIAGANCLATNVTITTPTATDNCTTGMVVVTGVRSDAAALNAPYPVGTTIITWTATDVAGKKATCTQNVIVRDTTPPTLTCSPNLSVNAAAGQCQSAAVPFVVSATDNCSTTPVNLVSNPASGSIFPVGVSTVTTTATDAAGNTAVCTFTVTVRDVQPPQITCKPPINVNSDPNSCAATGVAIVPPTATDNCSTATVTVNGVRSDSLALNAAYPVGVTTITWTATDAAGRTATCQQTVTVRDTTKPVITCAPNQTVNAVNGKCESGPVSFNVTATDNCSTASPTVVSVPASGTVFNVGTTTVTSTATDAAGNMTTCSFFVTVVDTQLPVITCQNPINLSADALTCQKVNVPVVAPTVSDNCTTTPVNVQGVRSDAKPINDPYPVGVTTIVWTATAANQQQSSCTQTVTIRDNTKPVINCPSNVTTQTAAGQCKSGSVIFSVTATDNCTSAPVNVVTDYPSGFQFPVGTTIVTATATDAAGNSVQCTFTVTVNDNQKPTIQCGLPVNVTASAINCQAANVVVPPPLTSDNCSTSTLVPTRSDGQLMTAPYPLGTTIVTWTVTDASGNTATCTQNVVVTDNTAPQIGCPTIVQKSADPGLCGATVFYDVATTDACGNSSVTLTCVPDSGTFFPVGTTMVTCTARDSAGNTSTCTFNVVVTDNEKPAIVCPANVMTCMQDVVLSSPVTSDNCGIKSVDITRSDNLPLNADYPPGVTTVTYLVTDIHNNTNMCQQLVMISEDVLPHIMCPEDVTVNALPGQCVSGPVSFPEPVIMDNCSTDTSHLSIIYNPAEGSVFPVGETTVTITVTDPMQNQTSCTFHVIVNDITGPNLTCPTNLVVNNTPGVCGASSVTYPPVTATDPCSGPVTVTFNPPAGTTFNVGVTTVTVTAKDTKNNTTQCQFTVTVNDTQKPTIQCPPLVDVVANANCEAVQVNLGLPITADNCSTVSVTGVRSDGKLLTAPYPVGTTTVTWTVTDSSGNVEQCVQSVIVRDKTFPTITCPDNLTTNTNGQLCVSAPVVYGAVQTSDNCTTNPQGLTVTFNPPSGTTFPIGVNTVIVAVTDAAQNLTTCSFTVTVNDKTPPMILCPVVQPISNTPGQCSANNVFYSATATDSCSGPVTVTYQPPQNSTLAVGTHTVTATATDTAGNNAQCTFTVTIVDTELPKITCPGNKDQMADADKCEAAVVNLGTPNVTDNCSATSISAVRSDGKLLTDPYPVGVTMVTWTVQDDSGNIAKCTQLVTIRDRMMPTIQCPSNRDVDALFGQCVSGPVTFTRPAVGDNCTSNIENLVVTFVPPSGTQFPVGTTTVTATVQDAGGNTASCEFTVTVHDITPPNITCPGNLDVGNTPGQCGNQSVTFELPVGTDTCSPPVTVTSVPAPGSAFAPGETTVIVTARDAADNISTCSFVVNVKDTEQPTLTCPLPQVIEVPTGECEIISVTYTGVEAPDNCLGPVTLSYDPPQGSNLGVGTHTIQVTATDAAGNIATCSFSLTVLDVEAPRIACAADITTATVPCDLDAVVPITPPEVLDPCADGQPVPVPVRSDNRPITDRYPVGVTTIVWTVTDANNNQSSCTQLITVNESQCVPVCDGPDLVVMAKMLPSYKCSKKPTCKVKGWYVITNIGNQTSGQTTVCFYLSDDAVFDSGDFQFKQSKKYRVKSLAPGEMVGVDLKGKAPKGVSVADNYIIAVADCPDVVDECREDNNETADHPMPKMKNMK